MEKYLLKQLEKDTAKEICTWKYKKPYDIYNLLDTEIVAMSNWDIAMEEEHKKEFVAIYDDKDMIAYGRINKESDGVYLGLGLRPNRCGVGMGSHITKLLTNEAVRRYPDSKIVLEVRTFNIRAIKCYEKAGFEINKKYERRTPDDKLSVFYLMRLRER